MIEPVKKKNRRVTQACNYCKLKRVKCSGDCPCKKCISNNMECTYSDSKKRGRKVKIDEDKYLKKFSDACNFLYNGIPEHVPFINNGNPKYDVFINHELINNFYKYSTFEFIPFLNIDIIKNRIYNKEIYFSLLFALYAISEIFKPFGDYNIGLKYKKISKSFLELCRIKKKVNNIQIIESFYILSLIESGNINDYFFTKWALITSWQSNVYDLEVPEYKKENEIEEKKNYISLVYSSVILKHMFAQIISGLIEYIEIYDSDFDDTIKRLFIDVNKSKDELDTTKFSSEHKIKPHLILMDTIKNDKNFSSVFKINEFTKKIDLNDLLLLKFKGSDVISLSTIKSLEYTLYMNQPNRWTIVGYNNICRLRNALFLYTNIKYKKMDFDAAMLIEEDRGCSYLIKNIPHEFKMSNNSYRTDPAIMYLYKRRFYSTFQANRIFLYRVILRLLLNTMSSLDLISNIKTKINHSKNNNTHKKENKDSMCERNKYLYMNYGKSNYESLFESLYNNTENKKKFNKVKTETKNVNENQQYHNISDENHFKREKEEEEGVEDYKPNVKKIKLEKENSFIKDDLKESKKECNTNEGKEGLNENYIKNENENENIKMNKEEDKEEKEKEKEKKEKEKEKIKYWLNHYNYMEMTVDETSDFISSCIYHQIVFILKNILSKCIDYILNQNMYFLRIAKFKEAKDKISQYYETPCVISLYEYGIIYLSKYVANHGNDNYDNLINFSSDIEKLNKRIKKSNKDDNNWYIGRQEAYNPPSQNSKDSYEGANNMIKSENDLKKEYLSGQTTIISNNPFPLSHIEMKMENEEVKINDSYSLCDQILDLINISEGKDDISIGESLQKLVDLHFYQNIKKKCHTCKNCIRNNNFDNTKEMFIEILKLLKYFINLDEYTPHKCNIYKCHNQINKYLYSDSSLITYKYYYNELIDMEKYIKGIHEYNENFKYLVDKANTALKKGNNSFDIDTHFRNSFF